ncbi:MAG TPA: ABC transporter permease, partial [Acidimicrobiales bacterium]
PQVVRGRAPSPDRADEAALDPGLADRLGLAVGDRLTLESFTQDQVDSLFVDPASVEPDGPRFTVQVVGLVRSLEEVTSDNQGRFGVVVLSAAGWRAQGTDHLDRLTDETRDGMGVFRVVLRAQLHGGADDADPFLDGLTRVFGRDIDTTFSQSRPDVFASASDTLHVETLALTLFAAGAVVATVFAVGQAAARMATAAAGGDGRALEAMGLTRRERILAAALPAITSVLIGVAVAVPLAVAATPLARFGLTDRIEVDRSPVFDPLVAVGGAVVLLVAIGLQSVAAARRATRPTPPPPERLALPARARRAAALSMGARTAGARAGWPVAVAALALTGVVAVATFAASLDHLIATPALYGFGWDEDIVLQAEGEAIAEEEGPRLAADERVSGLSEYRIFEISFGGDQRIGGLAVERLEGDVAPTLLAGRLPTARDEIAVDPSSLDGPGPELGDVLNTPDLSDIAALRVVGLLTGTGLGSFVVSPEAAEDLHADVSEAGFLLTWADGVDGAAARADLAGRFAEVEAPRPTAEVLNLSGVRGVPLALGGFFILIGLATAGHTMVITGRRRRRDLAITRALGFTRRQAVAVLVGETGTVGTVGLILGLVVGTALGRLVWRSVADALRVVPTVIVPVVGIVAVGVAVIGLLAVVGFAVARAVVPNDPGPTLRAP